jgi:protein ImuB
VSGLVPRLAKVHHPFVLVATGPRGRTITAVNRSAQTVGVYVGQRLADARTAVPELRTGLAAAERDHEALLRLTQWAGRYGPRRNIEGSDGLWIDITGVAHLFGGEAALLADLLARLGTAGYAAQAAVADTPAAAFALCRYGAAATGPATPLIVPPGMTRAALAPLPVAALRLDADTVQLLHRLGLRRIGQLYDIPRPALAQRFRSGPAQRRTSLKAGLRAASGQAEAVLTRLDQALGATLGGQLEPRAALVVVPPLVARRVFAEPLVTASGIDAATADLAAEVCARLDETAQGARAFMLWLYRSDGSCCHVAARTSRPCRQVPHVLQLLTEKMALLDLGFGVDVVTLEASALEVLGVEQGVLARGDGAMAGSGSEQQGQLGGQLAALVDRLANRLGVARVFALGLQASHIPEHAARRIPAMAAVGRRPQTRPPAGTITGLHDDTGIHDDKDGDQGRALIRPAFLLSPPEPVAAVTAPPAGGAPDSFVWRRLRHQVIKVEGPERIAPEWWRRLGQNLRLGQDGQDGGQDLADPAGTRDYYRLEDVHGGRYWLFKVEPGAADATVGTTWYMHGVFG